jgi:hypothetical protein
MSDVKAGKRIRVIRLPVDLDKWLDDKATNNGGTVSTEIAREFRKLMNAEAKNARSLIAA